MSLFIAIIFIAELVIAGALINWIVRTDRQVNRLNCQLVLFMPKLESGLRETYNITVNLKKTLHNVLCMIEKRRKKYVRKIIQSLIIYLLLIFCKSRYRKAAAVFQALVLVRDYMDKLPSPTCNPRKIVV